MSNNNLNIFNFLFEREAKDTDSPEKSIHLVSGEMKARKSLDSVDDQIDALILRYESSSIRDDNGVAEDLMEYSMLKNSLKYLFEQEGDEPEGEDEDLGFDEAEVEAGDEEPATPVGSEKMDVKKPSNEEIPDLDIDAFATRTVRLIMNHRNLLRTEEAIINRIKNFLDEHYGDQFVVKYIDILEQQFGIETSEFDTQTMETTSNDIFAVGANAAGTSGGG